MKLQNYSSGIENLDKNAIITLSGLNVGTKIMVPGEELSKAITKLWDQNLFADISINTSKVMGVIFSKFIGRTPKTFKIWI